MKEMKKIISLVLCFVMVVGLLPMNVFATELTTGATEPTYSTTVEKKDPEVSDDATEPTNSLTVEEENDTVIKDGLTVDLADLQTVIPGEVVDAAIIFTDLHTSQNDYKESTVKGIMTAFKNTGLPFSSVTSGGDAFSVNSTAYTGYTDTLTGYIQSVFEGIPVNYTWSDHDRAAVNNSTDKTLLSKKSQLVYGAGADGTYGTSDDGNYYVYLLSMGDLASNDRYSAGFNYTQTNNSGRVAAGFTPTVAEAIANFKTDAATLDKTKPLLIVGHQPLFDRRGDNAWAEDWVAAINEVAEKMDVAYFFGHNHKYDTAEDYYYAKGSEMPVPKRSDWNWQYKTGSQSTVDMDTTNVTLNFTHACAGYLAPSSTGSISSTTRQGTALAVVIYDNAVTLTTYNASGKYTSSYALDATVARDHAVAPVLDALSISGKTEYIEGNELDLTVTATYSDGTSVDVTEEAEITCDGLVDGKLAKAGTYTVTATYEDKTATTTITVAPPTYTEWDDTAMISVQATVSGLTGMTVTNVYGDPDLSYLLEDYMSVDVQLEGVAAGTQVEYSMLVFEEIPTDGIVLYHIAEDGTETPVPFTMTTSESGGTYLNFTTGLTGIFAYGLPAIPADYTLTKLEVTNVVKTEYVAGSSLDMVNPIVTATYTKAGAEDIVRVISIYNEETTPNGYTYDGYNMAEPGDQTVTIRYGGLTTSFAIKVWPKNFSSNGVSVSVGTGDVGAKEVTAVESQNPYVDSVLAGILDTDTMVAYDISLLFNDGYSISNTEKIVTLPIPAGVETPAVYYVSNNGQTVEQMTVVNTAGNTVSFVTTHFSTYVVGEYENITLEAENAIVAPSESYAAKAVTVYRLVDEPVAGRQYLIVNSKSTSTSSYTTRYGFDGDTEAYTLSWFSGGTQYYSSWDSATNTGTAFNRGSDIYLTTEDAYLWTAGDNEFTIKYNRTGNNNYTYTPNTNGTEGTFTYSSDRLTIALRTRKNSNNTTNHYLRCSSGTWSISTTSANVYFYEPVVIYEVTKVSDPGHVYSVEADNIENGIALSGETVTLASKLFDTPTNGSKTDITSLLTPTYTVVTGKGNPSVISGINGNVATLSGTPGVAVVRATYTSGDLTAWVEFIVRAKAPVFSVEIVEPESTTLKTYETLDLNAVTKLNGNETTRGTVTWSSSDESIATVDANGVVTPKADGEVVITVTYTVNGQTLTDTVTLKIEKPVYALVLEEPESNQLKIGKTIDLNAFPRRDGAAYNEGNPVTWSLNPVYVPATGEFDSNTTYYIWNDITGQYQEADIDAFADGVTYYTQKTLATIDPATGVVTGVAEGEVTAVATWVDPNGATHTKEVLINVVEATWALDLCEKKDDGTNASITKTVIIKEVKANDTFPLWAVITRDGEDIGELTEEDLPKLTFTSTNPDIATVDSATGVVTFTGKEGVVSIIATYEYGTDKRVTDRVTFSVSPYNYYLPSDGTDDFPEYPAQGAVRFDKTATAVGTYSETGLALVELSMTGVPYTTHNRMDVVLMLDRSSSMKNVSSRIPATIAATKAFVKNIVMNEDGTFNNNRILVLDFLGGNLDSSQGGGSQHVFQTNQYTESEEDGYQIIGSQTELDALFAKIDSGFVAQGSLYGTEYAQGLEACYNALSASREDGNQQFCVFMSDGIPNYMMGETTHFKKTNDIVATFDVTNRTSSNGTASRNSTKYEYEYYSTQMKNEGVTVFTVGLGLQNTNSAWSGTSKEVCEQVASMLLNDISGPAGETADQRDTGNAVSKKDEYFFSVADSDAATQMENVFSSIAQKIKEAATDVKVEDKVGDKYSVNFSIPGDLDLTALNGLQNFYLQVVEYTLDKTTHERTGTGTVLEKFNFNLDGTLESHTVKGVACGATCSHVTVTDGKITKLDGTLFDYEVKADGEYLHWEAEKLTNNELALQYFAYLDNSGGVDPDDQIPAGTYYTNEYATLTYTNYKGNTVRNEFPVPQMTWNGAQVSYVFYLVNEAGQPVNRAGRVVPFAEAVFVSDVFTHAIVWNDLEQAAGLEAKYLAGNLVSDAYQLYDDDASYKIHVYEKETEVNLNNHFAIGGDVADDYKPSWTNPNTTVVFNTKADAEKYNVVGTYVANGKTEYLCKGDGTVSGVKFDVADIDSNADMVTKPYYVLDENGTYKRALEYTENTTYYELTAASYTPAAGETHWTPGEGDSKTGGTVIGGHIYYVDEFGNVYTIVTKTDGREVRSGFDFHNTTVAFAVVWTPALKEDTVVIDFGLDVIIDVATNDTNASEVIGVRQNAPIDVLINSGSYPNPLGAASTDVMIGDMKIGTATLAGQSSIKFSLDKENGMYFTDAAVFYYESDVDFYQNDELKSAFMYSSVTVIPATTVYYEDDFLVFESYTKTDGQWPTEADQENKWVTSAQSGTQDQDRPGVNQITAALDADNAYGYDKAYANMSEFSMGSAAQIAVDANTYGTASFSFCGTGFDLISMTSGDTGTITVKVANEAGETVRNTVVDTYYGYTRNADGSWTATPNGDALYQVPVIKIFDLPYGQYTVTVTAAYNTFFDHNTATAGKYDLYVDAVRVYDPAGKTDEDLAGKDKVKNAYLADGEAFPSYSLLRDKILDANTFNSLTNGQTVNGIVFIDSNKQNTSIADYNNYGPNNELYLAKGQSVAFHLAVTAKTGYDTIVRIGLKSVGKDAAQAELWNYNSAGEKTNVVQKNLTTATDMYYDISALANNDIVITNTGADNSILSITNIKVTYKPTATGAASDDLNAVEEEPAAVFTVTRQTVEGALAALTPPKEDTPITIIPSDKPIKDKKPQKPVSPGKPVVTPKPVEPIKPGKPTKPGKPGKGNHSCVSIGEVPGLAVARNNGPRCVID